MVDETVAPETFRSFAHEPLQGDDLNTELIHIIDVRTLAAMSNTPHGKIISCGEALTRSKADSKARAYLAQILEATFDRCDYRPIFAGFYDDFREDMKTPDWPNRLRDRLGLSKIDGVLNQHIFLFKYKALLLPDHPDQPESRPIAVPSVLDFRFSSAFCPAPIGFEPGRTVNLSGGGPPVTPARELLHKFMKMRVEYLEAFGKVTTLLPDDLAQARRSHLNWLRNQPPPLPACTTYADSTDSDMI